MTPRGRAAKRQAKAQARRRADERGLSVFAVCEFRELPFEYYAAQSLDAALRLMLRHYPRAEDFDRDDIRGRPQA